MAADDRPIIIKRIKKSGGGHHGGAWKVAYADFVTAMMAFFLLLWLLGNTTEEQRRAIGNYFKPTISSTSGDTTVSVLDGQTQVMETMSGGPAAEAEIEEEGADTTGTSSQTGGTQPELAAQGQEKINAAAAAAALKAEESKKFEQVKKQIEQVINQTPELTGLKDNLQVDQTPEGLRIQLLDKEKESMFASGSVNMAEKSRQLLALVAQAVKDMPNKLAISGHTDAALLAGNTGRTNWELSSDRANAARRVLVESGVDPAHVQTVIGRADTDPFIKDDPFNPRNRRISIVLLSEVHLEDIAGGGAAAAPPKPAVPEGPPEEIVPPASDGPGG
jgi:chemotaxis protein MotB